MVSIESCRGHGKSMHPQSQGKIELHHRTKKNLTPADVYFGRSEQILEKRRQIKSDSIRKRRQFYFQQKLLNL